MVFDIEAYNAERSGADMDKGLLVSFEWKSEKVGGDYKNIPYIKIWKSKNSEVVRRVTAEDKERFKTRWEAFERKEEIPEDGTPLNQIPFATPADISRCKEMGLQTAEQLAELPDTQAQRGYVQNLKYQVRDWMKSKDDTKYLQELRDTIEKQKATIESLQEQLNELKSAEKPKKRGRPKKNADAA